MAGGARAERPNQVWATDITFVPMARGFIYLAVVVDWFTRLVLAWRVLITMKADFCIEAVEEALFRNGKPEIFNADQVSQFTSLPFTGMLLKHGIAISIDGRGAWRDNIFVERLWRSVTYEEVSLRADDSVAEDCAPIGRYMIFTTPAGLIPALAPGHQTTPTSTTSRYPRQRDFGVSAGALLRSGYALHQPHPAPTETPSTGRGSTYRNRNGASTKPAYPV